jgi:hypothetical protein
VQSGEFEGTYSEYFGNLLEDPYADVCFLDCVVTPTLCAA